MPARARGREHLAGLREVERERLLADHVTAGGDRLERELRVLRGRCRDRHRVDAGDRERLGQRGARVLDPGAVGPASGALGVAPDDRPHVEAGGPERGNVHPRSERRTDHCDSDGAPLLPSVMGRSYGPRRDPASPAPGSAPGAGPPVGTGGRATIAR